MNRPLSLPPRRPAMRRRRQCRCAPSPTQSPAITPRELRLLGAAAGVSVLSALLVLGGQAAFFKPLPPPAPVIQQAKALTPEQSTALANADKLNKAIQKLDPKLRAQLQAELQK